MFMLGIEQQVFGYFETVSIHSSGLLTSRVDSVSTYSLINALNLNFEQILHKTHVYLISVFLKKFKSIKS